MIELDTAGADANGIARAGVQLTLALINLLIEKQLLTRSEIDAAVVAICESTETSPHVGKQAAAKLLRQTFGVPKGA
jgi:hypothetical protein